MREPQQRLTQPPPPPSQLSSLKKHIKQQLQELDADAGATLGHSADVAVSVWTGCAIVHRGLCGALSSRALDLLQAGSLRGQSADADGVLADVVHSQGIAVRAANAVWRGRVAADATEAGSGDVTVAQWGARDVTGDAEIFAPA